LKGSYEIIRIEREGKRRGVLIPMFKDGVKWWTVLNMGMDIRIQQKSGKFLVNLATYFSVDRR
jgi:hypothetical protein